MRILSLAVDLILTGYVIWEVTRFLPQYRQLKEALARGDSQARTTMYRQAIVFEWLSALLAVVALGFDWHKLTPSSLALESSSLIQGIPRDIDRPAMIGVLCGIAIGTVVFIVARLRGRGVANPRLLWLRKLIPDFSALIPSTPRERILWAFVALSAGICEEVVFRGWLLSTLHSNLALNGTMLIVVAAALFGLAHIYQGPTGVLATGLAGLVFCLLFVHTGSLLIPIALHSLVDLRFAILPAPRPSLQPANQS